MHWTQNQITGRTVKEEFCAGPQGTHHRHVHWQMRLGISDENVQMSSLCIFKSILKTRCENRNIPHYPVSHMHSWSWTGATCQLDTARLPPRQRVQVVLYMCVRVWGLRRTAQLVAEYKARIAQAEMMYDPELPQMWTQMGVIWTGKDWQLFESKHYVKMCICGAPRRTLVPEISAKICSAQYVAFFSP